MLTTYRILAESQLLFLLYQHSGIFVQLVLFETYKKRQKKTLKNHLPACKRNQIFDSLYDLIHIGNPGAK